MKKECCVCLLAVSTAVCFAVPIAIENHSFETPDSSGASWPMYGFEIDGHGWTVIAGDQGGFSRAIHVASAVVYNGHPIPEGQGEQVGLNQFDHTLYQDVDASYDTDRIYILTAKFGFSNQQPVGKMYLSLETTNDTVLAVSEYDPPAPYVQFDATTTVYMADHTDKIGEPIRVKIRTDQTGGQSNFAFDLVQLEEVPEPAGGIFVILSMLVGRKIRGEK
jgi:hypothetical protein